MTDRRKITPDGMRETTLTDNRGITPDNCGITPDGMHETTFPQIGRQTSPPSGGRSPGIYNGAGKERRKHHHPIRVLLHILAIVLIASAGIRALFPGVETLDDEGYPDWLPGSGVDVPDYVRVKYLPVNQWSRPGDYLREVHGIVIHYVGNPGSTAIANRNYFASLSDGQLDTYASSHFVVGLDGEVVQCIPLQEIAYASNHRNRDTIAIEVCHPDAAGKFNDMTYARCVELTAWLCGVFGLDPRSDVIRHYDVTGKICPRYYVEHPEAWDTLREDIAAALEMEYNTQEDAL